MITAARARRKTRGIYRRLARHAEPGKKTAALFALAWSYASICPPGALFQMSEEFYEHHRRLRG